MEHDRCLELLSARLDGPLTGGEERELEDHLAHCPDCRALAEQLEQVEKQLNKVIPVIKVRSLGPDAVTAELVLVKVACDPQTLGKVNQIAALMKAEVADVSKTTVTLKYAGEHERCETLLDLLRPYGIREISRTGVIALERG